MRRIALGSLVLAAGIAACFWWSSSVRGRLSRPAASTAPSFPTSPSSSELEAAHAPASVEAREGAGQEIPSDAGSKLGSIDVLVRSAASKQGVFRAPIQLIPFAGGREPTGSAATDVEGRASFEDLAPRKWLVDCALGERREVQVVPGERVSVEMTVPDGKGLEGVVRDDADAPILGAEIWISAAANRIPRSAAAVTDSEGRFRIPSLGRAEFFGARAKGYAPTEQQHVADTEGRHCDIRLHRNGKSIRGHVHDPAGVPIRDAMIEMFSSVHRAGYPAVSDREGSFGYGSVPDGVVRIRVAAPVFALWDKKLEPEPDLETLLDVALEAGGEAAGTVRDVEGRAMEGVQVLCGEQTDALVAWTSSAADGSYRLHGLPAGRVVLEAYGGERGRDTRTEECESGCSIRWDPTLGKGGRIGGLVVDEAGEAQAGVVVVAAAQHLSDVRQATTDPDGKFLIVDCPATSYRLDVRAPENQAITLGVLEDVRVGTSVARIVARNRSALIRGRVLDARGRGVPGASVAFLFRSGSSPLPTAETEEDGSFRSVPLFAGNYEILVLRPPYPIERLQVEGILRDESRELADIHLQDPASISLACRSRVPRRLYVRIETPDGRSVAGENLVASSDPLPIRIDRLPARELRLEILEGENVIVQRLCTPPANDVLPIEIQIPDRYP